MGNSLFFWPPLFFVFRFLGESGRCRGKDLGVKSCVDVFFEEETNTAVAHHLFKNRWWNFWETNSKQQNFTSAVWSTHSLNLSTSIPSAQNQQVTYNFSLSRHFSESRFIVPCDVGKIRSLTGVPYRPLGRNFEKYIQKLHEKLLQSFSYIYIYFYENMSLYIYIYIYYNYIYSIHIRTYILYVYSEHDISKSIESIDCHFNRALKVVEETQELLVVNKPSSLPIHPCGSYRSCLTKIWKKRSTRNPPVHEKPACFFFFFRISGVYNLEVVAKASIHWLRFCAIKKR